MKKLLATLALFACTFGHRAHAQCSSWSNISQIAGYHTNLTGVVIDQTLVTGEQFVLFFNYGSDTMGVWVDEVGNDYITGYTPDEDGIGWVTVGGGYTMTIACDKKGTGITVTISGNSLVPSAFNVFADGTVQPTTIAGTGASSRRSFDGWTMIPVFNSTMDRVEAVFAWADPLILQDDNIPFVAYLRDPVTDDYSVWGWPAGTARADALGWLADTYGGGAFASDEPLGAEASVTPALPMALAFGMPTTDPLQPDLEIAVDPAALVDEAVSEGLEAAPVLSLLSAAAPGGPVYSVAPCNSSAVLTERILFLDCVYQFEMDIVGASTVTDPDPCASLCRGCTTTYGAWPAWTVNAMPVTVPAGWSSCMYTRRRTVTYTGLEVFGCAVCTGPGWESQTSGPTLKAACGTAP